VLFILKYIKIIILFFKKLFLTSAHQNDLKTSKTYKFKAKKKILKIFQKHFPTAVSNIVRCKTASKSGVPDSFKSGKVFCLQYNGFKSKKHGFLEANEHFHTLF
jgi:hypothetical protein